MLDIVWRVASVSSTVDSTHATLLYKMSWMFGGLRPEAGFGSPCGTEWDQNGARPRILKKPFYFTHCRISIRYSYRRLISLAPMPM